MEEKEFLNGLLGVIHQPVFAKDENFIYTFCNQAYADALGFTKEQIIGSDVFQLYDREFAEIFHKADVELFEAGGDQHYRTTIQISTGTDHTVNIHKNVISGNDGKKIGIVGLLEDLTEQENREKELNESESKYKKIFENVQDIFYQIDLNGIITDISPSVNKYSEYSREEIIGKPIDIFYANPDERNSLLKEIQEKGEAMDFEIQLKGKNNRTSLASVNAHFLFDDKGKVSGIEGTLRDLTERRQADEKLKLSLSLLQATLNSTADGILVVDWEGKITNYNKQFVEIFHVPVEILESGDDDAAIDAVLNLFKHPEEFISKVQYLYEHRELDSFDTLEFKDGRVIERFSCPQLLDGKPIGRVWSFRDISGSKRAELELKENEERYRSLFESSPDAILLADIESGVIIDANHASAKLLKRPVNEIIGLHQTDIHPKRMLPDSIEIFQEGIKNALNNKDLKSNESLILRGDGSEVPVDVLAGIIHLNGKPVLQGIFRDITERKLAEKALQESESRYRLLIENQGEGLTIVDPEENILYVNPAAEAIFGVESEILIHRNLKEFIVPDQFEIIRQETGKRAKNEKSSYEIDIFTSAGIRRNILVTATPQISEDGIFTGTFGVLRDITERKKAEELLRQSEMKYRNLIESMPDGVYRSTPEGKFIEVNPAMVKMLGYDNKEELKAIDIKTELYFDPKDRESLVLQEELEEMGIFMLKKKDGAGIWVEDHGWYTTESTGEVAFHEGIMRDITDRKISEIQLHKYSEELQELNATKDKFFSIIAHDLKSPFNSISGLSEILHLEAKQLELATIEQYAGIIHSTSVKTFNLLENLLDWARLQQSRMPFNPEPVLLNKLSKEVIEQMIEKAISKKINLINSIPENLIVKADENMLKTVLRNLISNALKFTAADGIVEISARPGQQELEISVMDSGIGIKNEDIAKIFKIDSNFSRRGTENEKGTGLGLILCREFIEKHKGRIWVESEENKGSSFKFTLPIT